MQHISNKNYLIAHTNNIHPLPTTTIDIKLTIFNHIIIIPHTIDHQHVHAIAIITTNINT